MRGTFRLRDEYVYAMPVHFSGHAFYPVRTVYGDMTGISLQFRTDPEALLPILPEDFELLEPLVNVQFSNARDVAWMAGGEYRLIQVTAPVRYLGNAEGLVGEYVFVIWENKACPIIGGREEDGMPKLFADIACERRVEDRWFTAASYESRTFLTLEMTRTRALSESEVAAANSRSKMNYFGWRYLPNLGRGGASLSHATLYPQEARMVRAWSGEGNCTWTKLTAAEHPLQWPIIAALADLPVKSPFTAMMFKGSAQLNVGDSRALP